MAQDPHCPRGQLGFDALLDAAKTTNEERLFERATAHLPGKMEAALPFYRELLTRHHAAMMAADVDEAMRLREEAHDLARKLNGGEPGILAGKDAPGCVLARVTAAAEGTEPLWGQEGVFAVSVGDMPILIEMDGIFGICGSHCYWPGFSANVLDANKPFISETGYRSFLGIYADPMPGWTPADLVKAVIANYIEDAQRGKPVAIAERYRKKGEAA